MIGRHGALLAWLSMSAACADITPRPRRARHRGEQGMEVLQVVILAAFLAALAIAAAAIIKTKVLDTANNIQTQ